jgi:transcriptional antiterminator RfaH
MLDTAANPALDTPQQVAGKAGPTPSGSRPSGPRWHVVATHSQAERRATYNLAQQGYETYLPLVTVRRRDAAIRSLMHRVEVPLFAGYAFVRFDALRDPWRPITNTPGVYALLRSTSTGLPHPCPDAAVEALRAGDALRRTLTPPGTAWAAGAACKAAHGPFKGHEAVVISVTGAKATIALPLFGGLRELTVPVEWLVARES